MGKKLSISMLVSGREGTTQKCLDSLLPLLKAVSSELILVDTGCGEETKNLLTKYTDKIISFEWCNDFAKARNVGLEVASGEWFMFLDDDEWFEDVTPLVEFFNSEESKNFEQAVYRVRNYHDLQGTSYSDCWVSRIIRLEEDTHFEGRVHEMLIPAKGKCKKIHAFVHHYGYAGLTKEVLQKKYERNVPLLLEMIKDEPNNMRWRLQLLQEYNSVEMGKEMKSAAIDAIAIIDRINDSFVNQCRGVYQTAVLIGDILNKEYTSAMNNAKAYLEIREQSAYIKCSLAMQGLIAASEAEAYDEVQIFFEIYWKNKQIWETEEKTEQQQIIEETLFFVNDAVRQTNFYSALRRYAVSCIRTNQQNEIPHECRQELSEMMYSFLKNRGDFLQLSTDVWEIAKGGIIDFEAMLLLLDMAQWLVLGSILVKQGITTFKDVYERLSEIRVQDDIRYRYLDMEYYKVIMTLSGENETFEALYKRFYDYTISQLNYYTCIFKDAAFTEYGEMLPPDARAALWLERFFTSAETDWETKFHALRMCAKEYPALGENVKLFAKFLGEEQERIVRENQQRAQGAADELSQMLELMKAKIREMIALGLYAEAFETIQQVTCFSNDVELRQLEQDIKNKML